MMGLRSDHQEASGTLYLIMPRPLREPPDDATFRYAKRHPGRTADEDGSFAAGFGAMDAIRMRANATAIALASDDRVDVPRLPDYAVRGIVQVILINARAVDEFKPLFETTPYNYVRATQDRLARAEALRTIVADPNKLDECRLTFLSKVNALGDISGERMEAQLHLARARMESCEVPRDPTHSDVVHTMKLGCAADIYGACKKRGHRLLAGRGSGAPPQEQHISFYFGVYLHFLANNFKVPTATDCADLSLHWLFDSGTREGVIDRWRNRLRQDWAKEMRVLAHELFAEPPTSEPSVPASETDHLETRVA